MKLNFFPSSAKATWQSNKPFLWFVLSLLFLYSVLKIIFYYYNYQLVFTGIEGKASLSENMRLLKWSLFYDLLIITFINGILLLLLQAGRFISNRISAWFIVPLFFSLNSFAFLLNVVDVLYFRFRFQRSNADLLYVIDHPFSQLLHFNMFIILVFTAVIAILLYLVWKLHKNLYNSFLHGSRHGLISILVITGLIAAFIFKNRFTRVMLPAYPLIEIKSNTLPLVQNSFHTFVYSVFRGGQELKQKNYFPAAECDSITPIRKLITPATVPGHKKNIVLFIMESVPFDFFDSKSTYKVEMPFFDSILQKSIFFDNAFCYAHESNKGITAILTGVPTLTDIPLYHSQYVNMPFTAIGKALKKESYHSFFCIGDEYDNFGFAKCMNWLGIDNYYSKEDIPGYRNLPSHSMGLQDEYVLPFFLQKINREQQPFFAIHYNISTHYPYDIPERFSETLPETYTAPMKSMRYYDYSLQQFFKAAENKTWFKETVFIFCSDHWLVPDDNRVNFNAISGYRIPIIIYNPSVSEKKTYSNPVGQFDVMGTVLALAGYKDSIITYGNSLPDSSNRFVISKANAHLYHIIDSAYILGFNISNDKAEFLYQYKIDRDLKHNLLNENSAATQISSLTREIKAFLQKAKMQYNRESFK